MSNNNNDHPQQKSSWAQEAEQLKQDLAKRKKTYKRNPKEIKFGPQKSNQKQSTDVTSTPTFTAKDDDFFRNSLGI